MTAAPSCDEPAWEVDPDAWKNPPGKDNESEGSYLAKDQFSTKQVKPSQKAAHDYSAENRTKTPKILFPKWYPRVNLGSDELNMVVFRAVVEQWRRETGHFSVFSQKATHPLYQAIIAMGEGVLPTLIAELKDSPRLWFWALRKIANCNPVRDKASVEEAVEDWTSWWNDRKKDGVD